MGALTDGTIRELVKQGLLIEENFIEKNLTPNGYDLTIGEIKVNHDEISSESTVPANTRFIVSSREYMNLTNDVIGMIWIRSSYARKGVLGSFGLVDAGFRGNLTLTFFNSSPDPLEIKGGDRIAQIVFVRLESTVDKSYSERSGNYQNSRGISLGK